MNETTFAILLLFGSFFLLMFLRVGIGFSMGVATVITMMYLKLNPAVTFQGMVNGINVFTFMAVPFFILSGDLMGEGGISERLVKLANALVGWMRGGLAMVNCVDSMFFGGISGSASADCASLGPIVIPMMTKQGYDKDFSTCLTMATSVQGMLIPPSHNMVVYAVTAGGVSIGALFMGGLIPGLLLGVSMMVFSYFVALKRNYPVGDRFNLKNALRCTLDSFWGLMTIIIIMGGVIAGVMTATESAAIAVLWAAFVSVFIYKGVRIRDYYRIASKTIKTLSIIMILIAVSYSFGWVVTFLGVPRMIASGLLAFTSNKYVLLLLINVLLLVLGMVMSMSSIILILTPILVPVLGAMGIDLVHFGVILILNLGIGLLTPPVGGVLYIGSAISDIKVGKLTRAMLPFYAVMVTVLLMITYIPEITMWLPSLMK